MGVAKATAVVQDWNSVGTGSRECQRSFVKVISKAIGEAISRRFTSNNLFL